MEPRNRLSTPPVRGRSTTFDGDLCSLVVVDGGWSDEKIS